VPAIVHVMDRAGQASCALLVSVRVCRPARRQAVVLAVDACTDRCDHELVCDRDRATLARAKSVDG
jgi:hypothetical protein